jgi:hypothetical protein
MHTHPFSSFLLTDFTSLIGDAIPKAYLSRSGIGEVYGCLSDWSNAAIT